MKKTKVFIIINIIGYFICAYASGKFNLIDLTQIDRMNVLLAFAMINVLYAIYLGYKGDEKWIENKKHYE